MTSSEIRLIQVDIKAVIARYKVMSCGYPKKTETKVLVAQQTRYSKE